MSKPPIDVDPFAAAQHRGFRAQCREHVVDRRCRFEPRVVTWA
jgi:hypothetical protein